MMIYLSFSEKGQPLLDTTGFHLASNIEHLLLDFNSWLETKPKNKSFYQPKTQDVIITWISHDLDWADIILKNIQAQITHQKPLLKHLRIFLARYQTLLRYYEQLEQHIQENQHQLEATRTHIQTILPRLLTAKAINANDIPLYHAWLARYQLNVQVSDLCFTEYSTTSLPSIQKAQQTHIENYQQWLQNLYNNNLYTAPILLKGHSIRSVARNLLINSFFSINKVALLTFMLLALSFFYSVTLASYIVLGYLFYRTNQLLFTLAKSALKIFRTWTLHTWPSLSMTHFLHYDPLLKQLEFDLFFCKNVLGPGVTDITKVDIKSLCKQVSLRLATIKLDKARILSYKKSFPHKAQYQYYCQIYTWLEKIEQNYNNLITRYTDSLNRQLAIAFCLPEVLPFEPSLSQTQIIRLSQWLEAHATPEQLTWFKKKTNPYYYLQATLCGNINEGLTQPLTKVSTNPLKIKLPIGREEINKEAIALYHAFFEAYETNSERLSLYLKVEQILLGETPPIDKTSLRAAFGNIFENTTTSTLMVEAIGMHLFKVTYEPTPAQIKYFPAAAYDAIESWRTKNKKNSVNCVDKFKQTLVSEQPITQKAAIETLSTLHVEAIHYYKNKPRWPSIFQWLKNWLTNKATTANHAVRGFFTYFTIIWPMGLPDRLIETCLINRLDHCLNAPNPMAASDLVEDITMAPPPNLAYLSQAFHERTQCDCHSYSETTEEKAEILHRAGIIDIKTIGQYRRKGVFAALRSGNP